ncbi:MAG: hypothetical protein GY928_14070 [Colwellia sp.]|nr:hypothetical protein [Colwellia sp.]
MKHDRELRLAIFGAVFSVLLGYIGNAIENFSWTKLMLIIVLAIGTLFTLSLIGTLGTILRRAPMRMDGQWILNISQLNCGTRSVPVFFNQSGSRVVAKTSEQGHLLEIKGELMSDGVLLAQYGSFFKKGGFEDVGTIYLRPAIGGDEFRGFFTGPTWNIDIETNEIVMKRVS